MGCGEGACLMMPMMPGTDRACSGVSLLVMEVLGQTWAGWYFGLERLWSRGRTWTGWRLRLY